MYAERTVTDEEYEEKISNLLYVVEELKERNECLLMEINDILIPEIVELRNLKEYYKGILF